MECEFSWIEIDQDVTIDVKHWACARCEHQLTNGEYLATYKGHSLIDGQICDTFLLKETIVCPHCDDIIGWAPTRCKGQLLTGFFKKVEVKVKLEDK